MNFEELIQKLIDDGNILKEIYKIRSIGIFKILCKWEEQVNDVDILIEFSEPIGWK